MNQAPAYQWQCIRQLAQENVDLAATNSGESYIDALFDPKASLLTPMQIRFRSL